MTTTAVPSRLSWPRACLLVLPAAASAFLAGWWGVLSLPGGLSFAASVAYLALDLAVLQPRLAMVLLPEARWFDAIAKLDRAPVSGTLAEVMVWIKETTLSSLGTTRALLVITETNGKLRLVGGDTYDEETVRDFTRTVDWLAQRDQITGVGQETIAVELLEEIGCQVAIPVAAGRACLLLGMSQEFSAAARFCLALGARVGELLVANKLVAAAHRAPWNAPLAGSFSKAVRDALMPGQELVQSDGFAIKGVYRTANNRGGDFWSWRSLGRGKIMVVVGQCEGEAVDRVLLAATSKGVIDATAMSESDTVGPAAMLSSMNDMLVERELPGLVSVFAAVIDRGAREMRFARAGELSAPLLLVSGDDARAMELTGPTHAAVGSQSGLEFEEQCQPIVPGTKLVVFSNGVVAMGGEDGADRLRAMVSRFASRTTESLPSTVLSHLRRFLRGRVLREDRTLIVVEYLPS